MSQTASPAAIAPPPLDMTLEVIIVPVSDVERAKRFYGGLGWRLDIDFERDAGYRVIQFTPPGSGCSIIFGAGVTTARPGSLQGLHLIVRDIAAARADLLGRGVEVEPAFHDAGGIFHPLEGASLRAGANPDRKSYASFAAFRDPDGNGWILQEVTTRLTGPPGPGETDFTAQLAAVANGTSGATASV